MTNTKPWRDRLSKPASHLLILAVTLFTAVTIPQSVQAQGYQETVLHTFTGPPNDTETPNTLIRDENGNLYGTTNVDVFKLDPDGKETVYFLKLRAEIYGPLVRDPKGNLYFTVFLCKNPEFRMPKVSLRTGTQIEK